MASSRPNGGHGIGPRICRNAVALAFCPRNGHKKLRSPARHEDVILTPFVQWCPARSRAPASPRACSALPWERRRGAQERWEGGEGWNRRPKCMFFITPTSILLRATPPPRSSPAGAANHSRPPPRTRPAPPKKKPRLIRHKKNRDRGLWRIPTRSYPVHHFSALTPLDPVDMPRRLAAPDRATADFRSPLGEFHQII